MGRKINAWPTKFERRPLAALRQARGITLEQIADNTKISMRFLRAIEDEEFEKLPGGIFNISYIRQYARAIEREESEILEYYNLKMGVESATTPANENRSSPSGVKGFRFPVVLPHL